MSDIIPISTKIKMLIRLILLPITLIFFILWPSGNWYWIDGWLVIIAISAVALASIIWLYRSNPEIIVERMKGNFQEGQSLKDTILMISLSVIMLLIFPIAALDYRNNWVQLPALVKILGWICFLLSLYILFQVFKVNRFVSRSIIIQEERDQVVIDTGLYSYVRHPMYSGILLFTIGLVLALGSCIALIPTLLSVMILYLRAISEEDLLEKELDGYLEYKKKVPYRLIPKIL